MFGKTLETEHGSVFDSGFGSFIGSEWPGSQVLGDEELVIQVRVGLDWRFVCRLSGLVRGAEGVSDVLDGPVLGEFASGGTGDGDGSADSENADFASGDAQVLGAVVQTLCTGFSAGDGLFTGARTLRLC